ncbi:MAG: PAS domain S-box protein [Thermoleophilia bacterium]|nr:PAS domain S-box protein [Thermoleophilia bacterium]
MDEQQEFASREKPEESPQIFAQDPVSSPSPEFVNWLRERGFRASRDAVFFTDDSHRIIDCNDSVERLVGSTRDQILGRYCWELFHGTTEAPPYCPLMKAFFSTQEEAIELCLKDRSYAASVQPIFSPDGASFVGAIHIVSDVTEYKHATNRLRQKAERLAALVDIARNLAKETNLETLLETVAASTASLCGFDAVAIRLVKDQELVTVARYRAVPFPFSEATASQMVADHPHMQRALATGQPVAISDTSQAHFTEAEQVATAALGFKSVAFIPLVHADQSIGVMVAGSRSRKEFGPDDLELMAALASISALQIVQQRDAQQLREAEARFLRLAEHARDLVYRYELYPKRGFTYVSPGATEITGYTPEEHYADPDLGLKIVHPDDRPLLEQAIRGELDPEKPLILRWIRKDGQIIWTSQRNLVIRDETGRPIAVEGTARDITAQREAEIARHEAEERYRSLVELAPVAVLVVKDHKIIFSNSTSASILGFGSADELVGLDARAFVAPRELQEARYRLEKTLAGARGLYPVVGTWLKRDGSPVIVQISASPITYKGEPALLVVAIDITARRRAEDALEQERAKLQKIADSFPGAIGMCRLSPERHVTIPYASQAVEQLTGLTPEQLSADAALFAARIHPADLPRVRDSLFESLRTLGPLECEFRYLHPEKREVWLAAQAVPWHEEDGSTTWSGVLLDITTRKKAEAEHEAALQRLFEMEKLDSVAKLAGGVAHEFNNMLSVILGYSQSLLDRLAPEDPNREDIEEILRAAERSAHLTQQLLTFSGKQMREPALLNPNSKLKDMETVLRGFLGEDVNLELDLGESVGEIRIEPGQFEQMIMNLVLNARDAMPQGGKLTIATRAVQLETERVMLSQTLKPGTYVAITVEDTGHGIPEDVLPRIFEPFFTTKARRPGAGLGLTVVQAITRQSQGAVEVRSQVGQGTIVEIYLPSLTTEPRLTMKPTSVQVEEPQVPRRHILVVEDEEALRNLFRRMLGELGYEVTLATDGGEALALIKGGLKPDLVLTDVVMPGTSGPAMAAQLEKSHPDLKVVFMSGYPDDAIERHGGLRKGVPFLQKPVTMSSLAAKLEEVFGKTEE